MHAGFPLLNGGETAASLSGFGLLVRVEQVAIEQAAI